MSSPLILTLLAGSATFIGAIFGVIGQKPSNRLLGFSLGFAAGIMLLISLMEMLPAALAAEDMSPLLGYGMFVFGLLGLLWSRSPAAACPPAGFDDPRRAAPAQFTPHRHSADVGYQPA